MPISAPASGTAGRSGSRSTSSRGRRRLAASRSSTRTSPNRVPYPIPAHVHIEGGAHATGDRHAILVDKSTCRLYELYDLRHAGHGWTAGLRRGLEPPLEPPPARGLDVRRRRRAADLPRPRALGRGQAWRDRPRAPLHRAGDAARVRLSGTSLRLELERPVAAADGAAGPPQGEREHRLVPVAGPRRRCGRYSATG